MTNLHDRRSRTTPGETRMPGAVGLLALLLVPLVCVVGSCAPIDSGDRAGAAGSQMPEAAPPGFEGLNATLWTQRSVEYDGIAWQAYVVARIMLERALEDPSWSAALEQSDASAELPPAVILDVDETVLDNSPYQARLVLDEGVFERETWDAWVLESAAEAVPGALEFCQYAASRGVTVVYLTNRRAHLEEATRANLAALGFPIDEDIDAVLTRGERPEWDFSDKGPRRQHVAATHRILLLIGDNMGDFVSAASGTVAERATFAGEHADWWGRRWIVLPNSQYGSWEGAIIGYDYSLPLADQRRLKLDALDPSRPGR